MYSLYGVVEHKGTLHSGHYMAKVRKLIHSSTELDNNKSATSRDSDVKQLPSPEHGPWCHASDSYTREAAIHEVHSSYAYLLFYERTYHPNME